MTTGRSSRGSMAPERRRDVRAACRALRPAYIQRPPPENAYPYTTKFMALSVTRNVRLARANFEFDSQIGVLFVTEGNSVIEGISLGTTRFRMEIFRTLNFIFGMMIFVIIKANVENLGDFYITATRILYLHRGGCFQLKENFSSVRAYERTSVSLERAMSTTKFARRPCERLPRSWLLLL